MVVQHNLTAINANRYYGINNSKLSKSLEKLSSGYAINRAGDNAAGLAVSEKMRAQISGLSQATKNAQDGISMVQTFEGALTETDSILQRMRSLAVQSANGTYQNDVDREAIQLEFDQLNDELNQISDTDFNGVVVLNGGQMADGLKVNADGEFDYKTKFETEAAAAAQDAEDLKAATDIGNGSIIDNSKYNKTEADAVWKKLGLDVKDFAEAGETADLNVTFTYDGTNWKATGVTDKNGNAIDVSADKLASLSTTKVDGSTTVTGKGGFTVDGTSINAIFDTTDSGKYDQLTINFKNINAATYAPANAGIKESSFKDDGLTTGKGDVAAPEFALHADVTDAKMSADLKDILDGIKGNKITATYDNGVATGTDPTFATDTVTATSGTAYTLKIDKTTGLVTAEDANNNVLNIGTITMATDANNAAEGTVEFEITFDAYNYVDASTISAESKTTDAASKAKAGMFDEAVSGGVSKSDSNDASTATLTYKKDITLQVGARTKDSVNFTFSYESNGLGDLKADLDCSARGLGTDKLSLATQEDANAAIDKIDNAINKVSMVRGTFGAMQNRLEHKIDNLNTTNENLTAAESRIRDTDMASEMMNFTKNQILSQAAQSMLAQANQLPQSVLSLLQ